MRVKTVAVLTICASLAFCASAQKKVERARAKDPKYQYNLGNFYLNQNNVDEAIKSYVRALSLDTRFYPAYNALGLAHSMRGRLDEAAKSYLKCLEINPGFTEARNNLGTVYQEMKQYGKAEAEFKAALQDPGFQNRELPYFNLARLYVLQDRLDEAAESVDKALQIRPRLAMAHNLRGLILEKKNDLAGAVAAYEQAVKIVPDDVVFSYNLAVACFKSAEYAKAKELFLRLQGKVSDAETKDTIARYLRLIGDR
ncbi:MAG TPA: tetratricopeptide repeat protein [Candidatus Aminicenantes bacterium]|nr:tetratricopeptide repeat protein [Candidatus Aminicenantes bacterium]